MMEKDTLQHNSVAALVCQLDSSDWRVVNDSHAALVKIGPSAVDQLISVLHGENRLRKFEAIRILGEIGDKRAVRPMLQLLHNADPALVNEAIVALGRLKDITTIPALEAVLKSGVYPDWRCRSAISLGQIGAAQAVEALLFALSDSYAAVRCASAQALSLIDVSEAIKPLARVLGDREEEVCFCAAKALSKLLTSYHDDRAAKELHETIRIYTEQLQSVEEQTRLRAAFVLGELGSSYPVKSLINRLQSTQSDTEGAYVAGALGSIRDQSAVPALIYAMKHGGPQTRWLAAEALGKIGNQTAVLPLQEALEDGDRDVRTEAGRSLSHLLGSIDPGDNE